MKILNHWLTTPDKQALLERQDETEFSEKKMAGDPVIRVDPTQTFQTMDGFGFSLTGVSAYLVTQMWPHERSTRLLRELFLDTNSVLRLTLGASDLSLFPFTYDDMPEGKEDFELSAFNIYAGDTDVIPVLRRILFLNPDIKIVSSPWSAPAWMKTNGSLIGGKLRPECYDVYAKYFVRYIQAMKTERITIHAVTVQNEPLNGANEPSMMMEAHEQADFIKNHLGPTFRAEGIETKIFCYDHNCDHPEYPLSVLADEGAREFVSGSWWHLYDLKAAIHVLSEVYEAHPDKKIWFTEQWVGRNGDFGGDLGWHAKHVLIGAIRNWAEVVLEWNLASDKDFALHTTNGHGWESLGAVTIDDGTVTRNVSYYLIGHLSKFVPRGSVRVDSNMPDNLMNVAFRTPDGKMVLLVWNGSKDRQDFNIGDGGEWAGASLEPGALATYVW